VRERTVEQWRIQCPPDGPEKVTQGLVPGAAFFCIFENSSSLDRKVLPPRKRDQVSLDRQSNNCIV
jgi:hypothetical protein